MPQRVSPRPGAAGSRSFWAFFRRPGSLPCAGLIGAKLGQKYTLLRLIGEGGMGAVYEAEQEGAPRRVAVKVIHGRHLGPDSDAASRFRREGRAASAIDSEHIVAVLDAGADEATGVLYLVMEHLSGQDLQKRVDHGGPLRVDAALCIAAQALMGLAKAHEAEIVHRDIKPANLFLARRPDGAITVKLLDFGIAKILADPSKLPHTAGLTTTSRFLGSPLYMSPEQVQSSRDVDHRTDLWSLGSALYCALAGQAPHARAPSLVQLMIDIHTLPPPPLRDVAPWVPPEVASVVHGALAQKPGERFPSTAAMLEAILRLLPGGVALREEMLEPIGEGSGAPAVSSGREPDVARIVVDPGGSGRMRGDATTELLARTPGWLLGLESSERTQTVRDLLLRDMARWGDRHVFGGAQDHPELPRLPLAAMYVEPDAGNAQTPDEPVLGLLSRLAPQHAVVVLRADFGQGKSLSARMLAQRLATACLQAPQPPSGAWWPLRVKCAEDFEGREDSLEDVLRRAAWRHASSLGIDLPVDDPAFEIPGRETRTLFLIDGLDEVALGAQEVKNLFQKMRQHGGAHRRFVVLSRPAALPPAEQLRGIPVLDLRPFRTLDGHGAPGGQVEEWLDRWNRATGRSPALRAADIAARGMLEIAKTPILLFMIAHSWDAHTVETPRLADVYEGFVRQMARGKYALDTDRNEAVALASEHLRDRLCELGHLPRDADPPEAMLWLMGRVAWQAKCLEDAAWIEGAAEPHDARHVREILRRELGLADDARVEQTIHIGLLLALQASFRGETSRILFGHRSFREVLAGRYWASRLRPLIQDEERRWEMDAHEPLLAGCLLSGQDETFRFLKEQLATWTARDRQMLARWAQRCFDDERTSAGAGDMWSDRRPLLREAALAIGSAITEGPGIKARSPETLRSLLAWFWLREEVPLILAPRLDAGGAKLRDATLISADLRGAALSRADLTGARLTEARLHGADLVFAKLAAADLRGADLSDADLSGADLSRVNLSGATLRGACFRGASLRAAHLRGADFEGADLRATDLSEADFTSAILRRANLRRAVLRDTDMREADLTDMKVDPGMIEALQR
jgi:uncharacterized protein YjbI with pentapeptide repeats